MIQLGPKKLSFKVMGAHTGDLVLALPAIEGARAKGHEVEVTLGRGYFQPLEWTGLTRVDIPSKGFLPLRPFIRNGRHRTEDWLAALSRHGIEVDPTRTEGKPAPSPLEPDYTLIQPWCEDPNKMWPVAKWKLLVNELERDGHRVVVAGPDSFEDAKYIGGMDYTGQDKGTWASTVASAGLVISVDSGAGHVADMLGVPNVLLYGHMPSSVWAPYWDRSGVIQATAARHITVAQVMEKVNGRG